MHISISILFISLRLYATLCVLVLVSELESEIEKQSKDWDEETKRLNIVSAGFEAFAKFATDFDLNTFVPEVHRDRLLEKIENAHEEGYLTEDQSNEMKTQVENAAGFDPTVVPSIHDIAATTKQELATRRRQADKKEGFGKIIKNELKSWRKGLKSMSKTAMVTKASNALSGLFGAVGKFGARNEDGTPDTGWDETNFLGGDREIRLMTRLGLQCQTLV